MLVELNGETVCSAGDSAVLVELNGDCAVLVELSGDSVQCW